MRMDDLGFCMIGAPNRTFLNPALCIGDFKFRTDNGARGLIRCTLSYARWLVNYERVISGTFDMCACTVHL